ncbi:blue copper protein 1a-like [Arachis stenosperma]|uniref:blue copper protein 1a-like n=1 Tax=Arachis stenosperma TaxID=217475 RepID=UPI0025AB9FC6|nr:blue copper protein 1a-like [Arachis stenosperma]
MASSSARLALIVVSMVLLWSVGTATDYVVGDDKGWSLDFNYTQWAHDKDFHVGDRLVFKYDQKKHNVFKVNGTLFNSCTVPNDTEPFSSGHDFIPLETEGRKWYICGKSDHCVNRQMKLLIQVGSAAPAPAPASGAPPSLPLSSFYIAATLAIAAILFV